MKLTELARELEMDPIDVFWLLLQCPTPMLGPDSEAAEHADIYSVAIPSYQVQAARDYLIKKTAKEVLDHVQGNDEGFKTNEDTDWEEEDD